MRLREDVLEAIKERGIVRGKLDGVEFYVTRLDEYIKMLEEDYRVVRLGELKRVPKKDLRRFLNIKFRFNKIFGFNTVTWYGKEEQG